jgi:hypothetical protein
MMATQAIASHGTLLKIGDGATPEVFTTVAEVGDITLPNFGNEKEDVTVQTTPGRKRDYKVTLAKDATVEFPINWDPADSTHDSATGLKSLADSGKQANFQIVLPDANLTTFEFAAIVDDFQPEAPVNGILKANIVLAVCGDIEEKTSGSGS